MEKTTTPSYRKVLIAALVALAPAGAAVAAQDCLGDPFAPYHRSLGGGEGPSYRCVAATWQTGAEGPSGPILAADMACGRDPFEGYRAAFGTGGPAQLCGVVLPQQAGAQGPAGPAMADAWSGRSDPFYGYSHTFPGD
jgi:hypothetical protein